MISLTYKEGVNKNNKKYMIARIEFQDKEGKTHFERFFVKPWNMVALAEAIDSDQATENAVKEIYG